jgi:hypothetical protein
VPSIEWVNFLIQTTKKLRIMANVTDYDELNWATSLRIVENPIRQNPQPWLQNSGREMIRLIRVIRSSI